MHVCQAHEKEQMLEKIRSQYDDWAGMAMTFNIINYVMDNVEEFRELIKNENVVEREDKVGFVNCHILLFTT